MKRDHAQFLHKCFHFMHCAEFSQCLVSIRSPLAGNCNHSKTQKTYNTIILIHIISDVFKYYMNDYIQSFIQLLCPNGWFIQKQSNGIFVNDSLNLSTHSFSNESLLCVAQGLVISLERFMFAKNRQCWLCLKQYELAAYTTFTIMQILRKTTALFLVTYYINIRHTVNPYKGFFALISWI